MAKNNLYIQRKKFIRHNRYLKNISRAKKLAVSLAISGGLVAGLSVPTFAAFDAYGLHGGASAPNTNPNACFGQARSHNAKGGPNSVLGQNEGSYMSSRKGTNSTDNIAYRQNCLNS